MDESLSPWTVLFANAFAAVLIGTRAVRWHIRIVGVGGIAAGIVRIIRRIIRTTVIRSIVIRTAVIRSIRVAFLFIKG